MSCLRLFALRQCSVIDVCLFTDTKDSLLERAKMSSDGTLRFAVNGKAFAVENPEFGTTLNSWLRSSAKLTGTKAMCKEGGCGSCVVMLTRPDPVSGDDVNIAVNSCLFPLMSVDGCRVTTTEGLVSEGGQYHAIQERIAHFNATQCGYCTPGFVMTMYSFLQKNPSPTQEEIEAEFDGNICRCTGFRSIFDAMKSFAKDADPKLKRICADIEDIKLCLKDDSLCGNNGVNCKKSCGRYHADGNATLLYKDEASWQPLVIARPLSLHKKSAASSVSWLRPGTLQQLTSDVKNCATQPTPQRVRFVVGNTSTGVFKNDGTFNTYIDTKLVKELYDITDGDQSLTIGANVCLNDLIKTLEKNAAESPSFGVIAKHIRKVANVPVRNVGSWIGNLSMKKLHPEFPSDVFTLFEASSVKLTIRDCVAGTDSTYSLIGDGGYMTLDMNGKVVLSASIPKIKPAEGSVFKALSYKVMPRSQNAHAYVNAAFYGFVQEEKITKATVVFGGISNSFFHAVQTEKYLEGKAINSQETLDGALKILEMELVPESYSAADSSPKYRTSVSLGLFFKFYLDLCTEVSPDVASATDSIERPLTSGTQSYDSDASMYPVSEPMPKVTAMKQASGEAKYISDFPPLNNELFAVFVTAKLGNADIDKINDSEAMKLPGFHSIITVADLPTDVKNSYISPPYVNQPIIAGPHVDFAGQPVAIVLADTQDHADAIADAVIVTYKNEQPVVCDMVDAIDDGMFFDGAGDPVVIGDAVAAIEKAPHKASGRVKIGSQYHFYMETQIARAKPTEDGFEIECATQWQDEVQRSLSYILGWDCNRFNIVTPRVGGAYGGKATNSLLTASAVTLASFVSGEPICFHVNMSRCMETYGSRSAYVADYSVGFDSGGKLQGIDITYFSNSGVSSNDSDVVPIFLKQFGDSGYHCPNWRMTPMWVKTNIASNTWCRAPVSAQLTMIMEVVLEHVAKAIGGDPIDIKRANLYVQNQKNLFNEPLTYCNLRPLSDSLLASAKVADRKKEISAFNTANKWKKRGLGFTPVKFGVIYTGANYSAQVSVFHSDGSVVLSAAGVDSGQGLNTKIIQVASYILGAPMDLIRVKDSLNIITPNSGPTGGSLTSELCCKSIMECCKILKGRISDAKKNLDLPGDTSWKDLVEKSYESGVDLTAHYWVFNNSQKMIQYNCYGAACSEVEMDIITGEFAIRRVDILYDCGQSINPEIDVGQTEGAFLMGVGYYTSERMVFDPDSGQLATNNTWEYKPPASKDIPTAWNVAFLKGTPNPSGILSSKAVGEPPLCTSASVVFALKRCIEAFRADESYFAIDMPATVENVQQLCQVVRTDFKI